MLGVDHDKIILLSTPFPTIPMLGKNCSCGVIVFYVGNKRCCIVLYCIVLYCIVYPSTLGGGLPEYVRRGLTRVRSAAAYPSTFGMTTVNILSVGGLRILRP